MKSPYSVNEAIDNLATLAGVDIAVCGVLTFEFENVAINHHPAAERRDDHASSIWLRVGDGSLGFDRRVCEGLSGRMVRVEGTLFGPSPRFGCGHMGLWPAELLARTLEGLE